MKINKFAKIPWDYTDVFLFLTSELFIFYFFAIAMARLPKISGYLMSFEALILYVVQTAISLLLLYYFTIKKNKATFKDLGLTKFKLIKTLKYATKIWLISIATLMLVSFLIILFFGSEIDGFKSQADHLPIFGDNMFGYFAMVFTAFLIAPFAEELIYRGFILGGLLKKLSPLSSILISSLIFSLVHFEFLSIIPLFIIGCLLGFLYYKQGSIWGCFIFHAINNGFAIIMELLLRHLL